INTFQYQSTICIKPSATLIKNGYLSLNMWRKFATNIDSGSKENIQSLVDKNKVVIFMKGIPEKPMCGFSNAVVQIMRMHGVEYDSYNVLEDDSLRAGIKEFSDWPTIPQVYMNGQFVGGCDILLQMHQSGDLIEEFKTVGIRSALLDKEQE
uniref:Glutaredoxin-related protein 5, mitochondrial n=1 Tax=Ciona savignyi TaxID=51511 RepID=H2YE03_CIOSA